MSTVKTEPEMATKNTDELIYVDKSAIFQVKQKMKKADKLLNDFYKSTVSILGELKPEQIECLPTDGKNVIKKELESHFQFPKASDRFNLDSLGIDPSTAYAAYKVKLWQKYNFEFKKGKFTLMPDKIQPEIQKYFFYANTPDRKNAVKLVRELIILKDKMVDAQLINTYRNADSSLFDLLSYRPITREKNSSNIVFNPAGFVDIFEKIYK